MIVRPNILMFGDYEWLSKISDQQEENYQEFKYDAQYYQLISFI